MSRPISPLVLCGRRIRAKRWRTRDYQVIDASFRYVEVRSGSYSHSWRALAVFASICNEHLNQFLEFRFGCVQHSILMLPEQCWRQAPRPPLAVITCPLDVSSF